MYQNGQLKPTSGRSMRFRIWRCSLRSKGGIRWLLFIVRVGEKCSILSPPTEEKTNSWASIDGVEKHQHSKWIEVEFRSGADRLSVVTKRKDAKVVAQPVAPAPRHRPPHRHRNRYWVHQQIHRRPVPSRKMARVGRAMATPSAGIGSTGAAAPCTG